MKIIYKHTLAKSSIQQIVTIPKSAKILKFGVMNYSPVIWYICDEQHYEEKQTLEFALYFTGETIFRNIDELEYIDSVMSDALVYHLFRVINHE